MKQYVKKRGTHQWVIVTDYENHGGGIGRSGVWVPQVSGGWWTHPTNAARAVQTCPDPVAYRTRREAVSELADFLEEGGASDAE